MDMHAVTVTITLLCRLGEGCSHTAAILFKVESAVRNGHTSTTSNVCQLNQLFSDKVCV